MYLKKNSGRNLDEQGFFLWFQIQLVRSDTASMASKLLQEEHEWEFLRYRNPS